MIDAAFSEWQHRESRPFEAWQRMTTQRAIFEPDLVFVATVGADLIGTAVGVQYQTEGFIDQVAVAPQHRGRGIAGALILRLYDEFRSRGEETIRLSTDSLYRCARALSRARDDHRAHLHPVVATARHRP